MTSPTPRKTPKDSKANRRRDALKTVMVERNLNARELGALAAVNPNSIYNFLSGRSKSLSADTLEKLTRVLPGESVASLSGISDPTVAPQLIVKTAVKAGAWRSAFELPEKERETLPFPLTDEERRAGVYGAKVLEPGAELLFPEGTILVCWPAEKWSRPIAAGLRVILQAIQGAKMELTARDVQRAADGTFWLTERSTDPEYHRNLRFEGGELAKQWRVGAVRYAVIAVVGGAFWRHAMANEPPAAATPKRRTADTKKPPRSKPRGR